MKYKKKKRIFQLRPHQHQIKQTYRTSSILSIKLPLKLYWIRFSGFCTALQRWFSFLSHYYNLLQFSLPCFATLTNVTYFQSVWFLLPTGSTLTFLYLIHLVVLGSSLQFAEIIWIAVLPFAVFAILLHDANSVQFYHPNHSGKYWVESRMDTHLPLQTLSQLNSQTLINAVCEQVVKQLCNWCMVIYIHYALS